MNFRPSPRVENLIYGLLVTALLLLMAGVDVFVHPGSVVGSAARSTDRAHAGGAPAGGADAAAAQVLTVPARKAPS